MSDVAKIAEESLGKEVAPREDSLSNGKARLTTSTSRHINGENNRGGGADAVGLSSTSTQGEKGTQSSYSGTEHEDIQSATSTTNETGGLAEAQVYAHQKQTNREKNHQDEGSGHGEGSNGTDSSSLPSSDPHLNRIDTDHSHDEQREVDGEEPAENISAPLEDTQTLKAPSDTLEQVCAPFFVFPVRAPD